MRPGVVAVLACVLLALGAAQAPASGVLSSFTLTPASTQAGGDPDVTADLAFFYADGSDSVRSVTIDLAPGLIASIANVPATCSPDELSANACPAGSQIGSGTATVNGTPYGTGLYLMPPPSPSDGAGFGTAVMVGRTAYTGLGTLDVVPGAGGQPVGEVKLGVPVVGGEQVNALRATMHGTTAGGLAFTRLPTSCSTATSSASAETQEARTGAGTDSFVPTGCLALGYAPALSAVQAIEDPGDSGAELILSLSQPNAMTESATAALALHWPSSSLVPNAGPDGACLTGAPCTIGTATASSPLAPASYLSSGTVTLGGTPAAPTLTVAFPPPVPLSVTGAVDLATGTVTFLAVPDFPLSALTVDITGPSGAKALSTTCAAGDLVATLTPQSGGAAVTSTQPIAYRGCASPKAPPPPPPLRVTIRSRRLPVVHGRTQATLACGGGAAGSVCKGKLALTFRERVVRRVRHRRRVIHKTIVLARARYAVASGQARPMGLRLSAAGLRLLERSRHRRLTAQATATLVGRPTARRAVVVVLAPARRSA